MIFRAVAKPWNSGKSAKFTKASKTLRNSVEILYEIHVCRTYLKFISANLSWNFVTETCKRRPETTRHRLCCEKLGTSHDVKGFAIGSFLEHIVVERANDDLCLKNVKKAGLISQSISSEFSLKITTKSAVFFQLFLGEVCPENCCEIGRFFWEFVPKNPTKFDFFSATYQKPCIEWHDPSDLKISTIEVGINLEVNWLCLCDLAHFLWWKQSKIIWNVCFNFSLLI